MPKASNYCMVYGCLNNSTAFDLSFFSLPKDSERCQQWLKLIDREDVKEVKDSHRVCSAHFDKTSIRVIKRYLKEDAVPALFLPKQAQGFSSESTQSAKCAGETQTKVFTCLEKHTQTKKDVANRSPRKRKLLHELKKCNLKKQKLEKEIDRITK